MATNVRKKDSLYSHLNPNGYVSCIRISGMPILPPLITEERRKEIQDDRNKAIMIEKRLKNKRNSTDSGVMTGSYSDDPKIQFLQGQNLQMPELDTYKIDNDSLRDILEDVANIDDNYVKHAIADDEFKRFLYKNIIKTLKENYRSVIPESESSSSSTSGTSCPENLDFIAIEDFPGKHVTKEILMKDNFFLPQLDFENAESNNEKQLAIGWNEIHSGDMLDVSVCKTLSLISPRLGTDVQIYELEEKVSRISLDDKIIEAEKTDPPLLVRRNSYVLESPSPALLEHMKNQDTNLNSVLEPSENDTVNCSINEKQSEPAKRPRKLWNHVERKAFLETCKNLHSPLLSSNDCTVQKRNMSMPSLSDSSLCHHIQRSSSADCILLLEESNKDIFTHDHDFQVSNIENKSFYNRNLLNKPFNEVVSLCGSSNNKVENGLKITLNDSPSSLENNSNHKLGSDFRTTPKDFNIAAGLPVGYRRLTDGCNNPNRESLLPSTTRSDDCYSVCSSISLNKFLPSQEENFNSPPSTAEDLSQMFNQLKIQHEKQLEELIRKQQEEKKILTYHFHSPSLSINNPSYEKVVSNCQDIVGNNSGRKSVCNRKLFPEKTLDEYSERERKAAEKICAYFRGYLTRRLLHTERVQQIIETIRESLLCALNLRAESALKPMDLELNTRLIQQLTSACYDLHDVFSLPVAQRMAIIATDREKKRKKTSRPTSASISSATRRSLYRKQQSLINQSTTKKLPEHTPRARTRSYSSGSSYSVVSSGNTASSSSLSKRCSSSHNTRQPWR